MFVSLIRRSIKLHDRPTDRHESSRALLVQDTLGVEEKDEVEQARDIYLI